VEVLVHKLGLNEHLDPFLELVVLLLRPLAHVIEYADEQYSLLFAELLDVLVLNVPVLQQRN
jgi:hypothetical protein